MWCLIIWVHIVRIINKLVLRTKFIFDDERKLFVFCFTLSGFEKSYSMEEAKSDISGKFIVTSISSSLSILISSKVKDWLIAQPKRIKASIYKIFLVSSDFANLSPKTEEILPVIIFSNTRKHSLSWCVCICIPVYFNPHCIGNCGRDTHYGKLMTKLLIESFICF